MKKKVLLFILVCYLGVANAQDWEHFRDISKYTKFTEKSYKIIKDFDIYSEQHELLNKGYEISAFISSKFAYMYYIDDNSCIHNDYLVPYNNGWISVDDLVLENSDIFLDSMLSEKQSDKTLIPIWYNSICGKNSNLESFSNYYSRYKGSPEYNLIQLHKLELKNTLLVIHDTNDFWCFSIKNLEKVNNIYLLKCEIAKNMQQYFNETLSKESLNNLPDLTENRNCTFIIEQNGNRLRLYNGENYKLIIELMQTDNNWNNSMLKYIESDYKNKPSNLNPIEEKLDHPWSDPKTGLYEKSFESKSSVTTQTTNVVPNKTMTVSENLKLRSGEATTSVTNEKIKLLWYVNSLWDYESYKLKNDYTLIIRPGIRKWNKGQEIYTKRYLIKNQTLIELPFEDNIQKFIGAKNYLFRYEGIDFKDYFCLTCFEGYDYYYLFNKITGKFEFKFRKTTVDINNEIIIFLDEKNDNDEMILYDLVTQKKYDLDNYITYGKYGSNTYWEDFKILKVTNSYYKVQFSGNYNEAGDVITQTFKVKK